MNELQNLYEKLPAPLKNRYFLVLTAFFGFMIFVDKHDFLTQIQLQNTVNKLEEDKVYYDQKIEEAQQVRFDMEVNKERFARERYFMQKNNEDVFIIVDPDENEEQ